MAAMSSPQATIDDLKALEQRVDQLLELCQRLHDENHSLRASQDALVQEKANLIAKNEQARSRVEAMISRLKALEQGT